jgi:TonB family protein
MKILISLSISVIIHVIGLFYLKDDNLIKKKFLKNNEITIKLINNEMKNNPPTIKNSEPVAPKRINKKKISLQDLSYKNNIVPKLIKNNILHNKKENNFTDFNTIKFKYYSFFNRIQKRLYTNWFPNNYNLKTNLTTEVYVVLNNIGELISIKIKKSSNNIIFDDIAIEAFKKSAPYPNPPKDLIENNVISFEWFFIYRYN